MADNPYPDYLFPISPLLAKTYRYSGEISRGKNGQTYRLESISTGVPFCLKTISPEVTQELEQERVRETLKKEVSTLVPLRHRCLPQIFEKDLDASLPYYVCTFHHGKTLIKFKELGHQFSREEGIYVVSSLIDVLEYLHQHGRTHCDLHAENLLISDKVFAEGILLIDFGSGHRESEASPDTPERGFLPFKNERGQARFRERLPRAAATPDFQESDFRALGNALSLMARPLFGAAPRDQFNAYQAFCHDLKAGVITSWASARESFASVVDPAWLLSSAQKLFVSKEGRKQTIPLPISHQVPVGEGVLDLINTTTFQRLRHTKQLSFCDWYYPGGTHTRFEHALGVFETTLRALRTLVQDRECRLDLTPENVQGTILASLLHDVGHYPFAHVLEHYVAGRFADNGKARQAVSHFDYTLSLIDGDTEIRQAVEKHWGDQSLIEAKKVLTHKFGFLSDLLNGPIDCDKLDYVRRDAYHCGVTFGSGIDVDAVISSLCRLSNGRLGIWHSGVSAVEGFMISQSQMLSEVYWHEWVRSIICMFHAYLAGVVGQDAGRLNDFVADLKRCAGEHEAMQKVILPWMKKLPKKPSKGQGTEAELWPLVEFHFRPDFRAIYRPIASYSVTDKPNPRITALNTVYESIINQKVPSSATSLPIRWDAVRRLRKSYYEAFREKGKETSRFDVIVDVPWGKTTSRVVTVRDEETDHEELITERSHLRDSIFNNPTAFLAPVRVFVSPALYNEFESRMESVSASAEEIFQPSNTVDLSDEL